MNSAFSPIVLAGMLMITLHSRASANEPCRLDIEIPASVREHRVVLFGEIHGTSETPALVVEYACSLAQSGRSVLLGLEIPAYEQARIDKYLKSAGGPADRDELLRGIHWSSQDGRASEAMLGLIEKVRELRQAKGQISILAFDGWSVEKNRDAIMADNISGALEANEYTNAVILAGNIHTMKAKGSPFDAQFEPMGYYLSALNPFALEVDFQAGTAWFCAPDCKVREFSKDQKRAPGVHFGYSQLPGYDGTIVLPSATASLPVKPKTTDDPNRPSG